MWRMFNGMEPKLDLLSVEQEIRYNETYSAPIPIIPDLIAWEGLEKSGTRSTEEAYKAC